MAEDQNWPPVMPIPWVFWDGFAWHAVPRLPIQLAFGDDVRPPFGIKGAYGDRMILIGPYVESASP